MFERAVRRLPVLLLIATALALNACDDDEGDGGDLDASTDTDTDGDTDTDSDSDFECDSGVDEAYQWHTFYGHAETDDSYYSGWDDSSGLAVDASGNTFVTGMTFDSWTGPGGEPPLHAHSAEGLDIFVLKLDSNGEYLWHTFHGAADWSIYEVESGHSLTTDESGNVYVAGSSDETWDGPDGQAPLHAHSLDSVPNAFVLKLDASGSYQWHTFYEGGGSLIGIDGDDNLYLIGSSNHEWVGPAGESPLHSFTPGFYEGYALSDAVVLKLDSSGEYLWHTFYGSAGEENGFTSTVDASGDICVAGTSGSSWNGPGGESPLQGFTAAPDIFVFKLDTNGAYSWHTFYQVDNVATIEVDGSGYLYLTGSSGPWTGPGGESPLHDFAVGETNTTDIYVLKLDSNGDYQWHTFYGSIVGDGGVSLAIYESNELYVMGGSGQAWSGPGGECPFNPFGDVVILKLDADGAYGWHTFYGDASEEFVDGREMTVGNDGMLYATGVSDASWDGPGGESPLHAYAGGKDIFVMKLAP